MIEIKEYIKDVCRSVALFADIASDTPLRPYQLPVAQAIVESLICKRGLSFVVMFPRQSGKNELQAQLECYLLAVFSMRDAEIVKVSPTWKPQSQNAMRRLERVLDKNLITRRVGWQKESGYIYRVGRARIYFFSGAPDSNIVGATASTLLEVDEAQDVSIEKYDKEVAPMAASTNATRVFWGTAWTSATLLSRELRAAQEAEQKDGIQRAFILSAGKVADVLPEYGSFVQEQVARLGRDNPMVKTQFFSEEIDAEGGMFNKFRRALMQGSHLPQQAPAGIASLVPRNEGLATGEAGEAKQPPPMYAITIDVAGEDEAMREAPWAALQNPGRDSTALTVFEMDTSNLERRQESAPAPMLAKPVYKVLTRHQWTGARHSSLFERISAIVELWQPHWIVIDATGVGQTLSSFLMDRYPERVLPFVFTSSSKSALGWNFIILIETGRYKEHLAGQGEGAGEGFDTLQAQFWLQVEHCQYHILEGPGQIMRWGVPEGRRDPLSGRLVHDDLLLSAALVTELDVMSIGPAVSQVVQAPDLFAKKEF